MITCIWKEQFILDCARLFMKEMEETVLEPEMYATIGHEVRMRILKLNEDLANSCSLKHEKCHKINHMIFCPCNCGRALLMCK